MDVTARFRKTLKRLGKALTEQGYTRAHVITHTWMRAFNLGYYAAKNGEAERMRQLWDRVEPEDPFWGGFKAGIKSGKGGA